MAVKFQDDNFRLACLDILFDAGYFEEELAEILDKFADDEEYELNPKRIRAFLKLPITQDQLDEITSFGPDGGDDIYFHVYPQWSGEEEELYIQRFDDVKLLRNLESISVVSMQGHCFDLSLLLPLKKLKEVTTDYFHITDDCDVEGTVANLESRGVKVTIVGKKLKQAKKRK